MQKDARRTPGKLDEFQLRDELRALRTQIPDSPALNPIVSLAFDLSRRLEAGEITFAELKALAGRLMDRACVKRARHLRERVGFVDRGTTYKEFADLRRRQPPRTPTSRPSRRAGSARAPASCSTAHPTFGLSDALSRRIVEIAVADGADPNTPHRRCRTGPTEYHLAYEHGRAQNAIQNLRNAYVELLDSFFSARSHASATRRTRCAPSSRRSPPGSATISTAAPTSSGRNSFILRLQEKRASLADIRERFLGLQGELRPTARRSACRARSPASSTSTIAAVDEQIEALDKVMKHRHASRRGRQHHHALRRLQHHDGRADRLAVADQLIDALPTARASAASPCSPGLMQATGLGTAHIHVRINAVQLNNAFRAFVHEPWTRDLSESQALARIVEHDRDGAPRDGQLRDARPRDGDRHPPVRADRADPEARRSRHADPLPHRRDGIPATMLIARLLRQAVRRRRHRRHLAAVRDAARPRDRPAPHRAPARKRRPTSTT